MHNAIPAELSPEEQYKHPAYLAAMRDTGLVKQILGNHITSVPLDISEFPLRDHIERLVIEKGYQFDGGLEELHEYLPSSSVTMDESKQAGIAIDFYQTDPTFQKVYLGLCKHIANNVLGIDCLYQKVPTFRFSFPGSPGYPNRDHPFYHSDVGLGHPPEMINVWLPLTTNVPDNTLRISSFEDSIALWKRFDYDMAAFDRFRMENPSRSAELHTICPPLVCDYGNLLVFDSRCMHVHQVNRSTKTRISMDFRFYPRDAYENRDITYTGKGRQKSRFVNGDYYAELP